MTVMADSDHQDRTLDQDPDGTATRSAELFDRLALELTLTVIVGGSQLASRNRRMASRTTSLILRLSWSAMRRTAS
jgi:hypothetical protein